MNIAVVGSIAAVRAGLETLFPEKAFRFCCLAGVAAVAAKVLLDPGLFDWIILERYPEGEVEVGALVVLLADSAHPPVGILSALWRRYVDVICGVSRIEGKTYINVCAVGGPLPRVLREQPGNRRVIEYRGRRTESPPELHFGGLLHL